MTAKPKAKTAPPKAKATQKYHILQISNDLGEVTGYKDPVSAINAATSEPVARGQYIVISDDGSVELVTLREVSSVNVDINVPKDLFK